MRTPKRFVMLIAVAGCCVAVAAGGCKRDEEISLYRAPKDPAPAVTAAPSASTGAALQWDVPSGWREMPGQQMRFATFAVNDANPPNELTVIALGPEAGALLPNVNRWEKQLGLPESPEAKLPEVVKHVSMNGIEGNVIDLTGPETANPRQRMLAAMVPAGGQMWFFKLVGPVDVVTAQKSKFDAFIASLRPGNGSDSAPAPAAVAAPTPTMPPVRATPNAPANPGAMPPVAMGQTVSRIASYQAPQGWQEIPGSQPPRMLAFQVGPMDDAAKSAQLVITRFGANNAGSFADNVTRWRGQIGLPPLDDPHKAQMKDITVGKDGEGIVLDFHNPDNAKRMLVVLASSHGDLWFVKLTGAADVVESQRANFETFVKSIEFAAEGAGK